MLLLGRRDLVFGVFSDEDISLPTPAGEGPRTPARAAAQAETPLPSDANGTPVAMSPSNVMPASFTIQPTLAAMATRECLSSAARYLGFAL